MEKKENQIGTRVNNGVMKALTEYCEKEKLNVSEVLREALRYYLLFKLEHVKRNIPIVIISKKEYATMLGLLDEKGLKKLADVCFKLANQGFNYNLEEGKLKKPVQVSLKSYLKSLDTFVFSERYQYWFKNFQTNFQGKRLIIAGVHDLNSNFSQFVKLYLEKVVSLYSYRLTKEKLLENKIIIEFQKS